MSKSAKLFGTRRKTIIGTGIILSASLILFSSQTTFAQVIQPNPPVELLMQQMTPEEKVGQLFLVTYYGRDIGEDSDIASLIRQYHVGGVILSTENDNFDDTSLLALQIYDTAADLQLLNANDDATPTTREPPQFAGTSRYVPLFIGIESNAGSPGYSSILSDLSYSPSAMALGATWKPELAQQVGRETGEDLAGLGINLLLGPSADVVEIPQPYTSGDLGTSIFGGEPYWVSKMVGAYVTGVHEGSAGQIAVAPRHFPGHGAADRVARVEVPTIRRSLEQLSQFDLIPFFAVTGNAQNPQGVADGLLTGHISYRGFQGDNPRIQTRPISFDQQALQSLLRLDALSMWRANGGLLITEALGQQGVRRLYGASGPSFPGRRIAQDALIAGNDLLYVAEFGSSPRENQTEQVEDTIAYFAQMYQSDLAFQARVDDALRRILQRKLALYDRFSLEGTVLPPRSGAFRIEQNPSSTFLTAQNAVSLLSPASPDFLDAPQSGDRLVIFTDTRTAKHCTDCASRPQIPVNALQDAIVRLYGPQGSNLGLETVQSFSFTQLDTQLSNGQLYAGPNATAVPDNVTLSLESANWVIFVMQDVNPSTQSSEVVKKFLALLPVSPQTRVVVMAMASPYYLDSTEVGKLTAYYGLFDYSPPFVDVAARALFEGVPFDGASPVTISGTSYNILEQTLPDPGQIVRLSIQPRQLLGQEITATPVTELNVKLGDNISVLTGVILDKNGHAVPDGTPVEFQLNYVTQNIRDTLASTTINGVAQTELVLSRPGELQITAQAEQATQSDVIMIQLPDTGTVVVTVESPNPTATVTPLPTATPIASQPPDPPCPGCMKRVTFRDWMIAIIGLGIIGTLAFFVGRRMKDVEFGLTTSLLSVIGGLLGYNYYALLLPGATEWKELVSDYWGAATATWLLALVGLACAAASVRWRRSPIPLGLLRSASGKNQRGYESDEK